MRRHALLASVMVIVLLGVLGSCLSYALYPWFGEDVQTFDERLLGTWGDEKESYTVTRGPDRTYSITVRDDQNTTDYRAVLGKIGDGYYLDLKAERSTEAVDAWELKAHLLCNLVIEADKLRVACLDDKKVEEMVASGELRGARVQRDKFLIVSGTEELQAFIAKHGPTADIWIEADEEEENWIPRM